jgi:hypothetical protein
MRNDAVLRTFLQRHPLVGLRPSRD